MINEKFTFYSLLLRISPRFLKQTCFDLGISYAHSVAPVFFKLTLAPGS